LGYTKESRRQICSRGVVFIESKQSRSICNIHLLTFRSAFSLQTKDHLFQICTTPLLYTSCKDCSSFRSNCCIGKMKVESSTNIPFFHRNEDSKHYRNVVKTTDTAHLENLFQKNVFSTVFNQKMKMDYFKALYIGKLSLPADVIQFS
jgi:hypothetical protein